MINNNDPKAFGNTASAQWSNLKLKGINAEVSFSPHLENKGLLGGIADDISHKTTSNLFYSLAFLYETPGPILDAIKQVTSQAELFVYGISDREVGGLDLQKPNGNIAPVFPSELSGNLPAPFKAEPTGGKGIRMHHKFVVIDFNKPTARVYLGSYNFSSPADISNGENLLFIRDQRIAVAYMIEALRIFDHYHFRVAQDEFKQKQKATAAAGNTGGAGKKTENQITLVKPPKNPGDKPWWDEYFTDALKIQDRMLFS
jgi:phosphatidylserine/phosphatidylglycerophosphate/cardiolipin synthase-like enzyme